MVVMVKTVMAMQMIVTMVMLMIVFMFMRMVVSAAQQYALASCRVDHRHFVIGICASTGAAHQTVSSMSKSLIMN